MLEKEILSLTTKNFFEKSISRFTQEIGQPKKKKRLALQVTDYKRNNLDTRIRITNGEPEIMQKKGEWSGESTFEISIPLAKDPEIILNTHKALRNMLESENVETSIMQMESYIFDTEKFELKFTHQTGKKDIYSFEIEVKDLNLDPKEIAQELELTLDLPGTDADYWRKFNEEVNLRAADLRDEEILAIIKKYL
jgi:hypothetical protein